MEWRDEEQVYRSDGQFLHSVNSIFFPTCKDTIQSEESDQIPVTMNVECVAGIDVGFATTASITDATPAALYAKVHKAEIIRLFWKQG